MANEIRKSLKWTSKLGGCAVPNGEHCLQALLKVLLHSYYIFLTVTLLRSLKGTSDWDPSIVAEKFRFLQTIIAHFVCFSFHNLLNTALNHCRAACILCKMWSHDGLQFWVFKKNVTMYPPSPSLIPMVLHSWSTNSHIRFSWWR